MVIPFAQTGSVSNLDRMVVLLQIKGEKLPVEFMNVKVGFVFWFDYQIDIVSIDNYCI